MGSSFFRFKQFTIWHDKCAMKVGTDGVLLGAWCHPSPNRFTDSPIHRFTILDIGTGSGLIALMLAQRFPEAQIDAIDIAPEAVEQAKYNFELSPWSDRLHAHLCSLQDWKQPAICNLQPATCNLYDLVVSNPPYFVDSLKNPDKGREMARHTDTLSYADLLQHSARLLSDDGTLALILPASAEKDIIAVAANHGLYPTRLTRVYSKPGKPTPIRILIEFNKTKASLTEGGLEGVLYLESPTSPRSPEYQKLTKDFYL